MSALQFLTPMALVALAPLAAAIIVLYLLKLRRRELVVSSTFLWQQAAEDVQANAPFQKLKRNLLMFLQLLALTALLLALMSPYIISRRAGGKSVVVLLDASASMQATDTEGSRFEKARAHAISVIRSMGRDDETAVVVAARRAWVAMPFTRDRRALTQCVQELQPTDTRTNMRDGLLLAESLIAKRQEPRIYVISDGGFGPLRDVRPTADVRFQRVGAGNDNVALLAFEATHVPGSEAQQLFVRLKNGTQPKECVLSIYREDRLLEAERLELAPAESRVATYDLTLETGGLLKAELDVEDDLAGDNVAYAYGKPPSDVSVLLVSPGNLFLEQGLLIQPEVSLYKSAVFPADEAESAFAKYDLVVLDRVPVPAMARQGALLAIQTDGPGTPATLTEELVQPRITRWERQHPACRYVNLAATHIAKANALEPSSTARVLAWAGSDAIIVADEKPGMRALTLGFNVMDTDLPLRVSFPVLLSNCVRWLTAERRSQRLKIIRPGDMLRFPTPPDVSRATVVMPSLDRRRVPVSDGQVAFAEADLVGVYALEAGDETRRWAVDMRSPAESDLSVAETLQIGSRTVAAQTEAPKSEKHLWPYAVLLGLAVLLGEWHLYHRRY